MTINDRRPLVLATLLFGFAAVIWFIVQVFGINDLAGMVIITGILGLPTGLASVVHYRRYPSGRWWLTSIMVFGLTFAILTSAALAIIFSSTDL